MTKDDVVAAYGADTFEIEVLPSTVPQETLKELVGGNIRSAYCELHNNWPFFCI